MSQKQQALERQLEELNREEAELQRARRAITQILRTENAKLAKEPKPYMGFAAVPTYLGATNAPSWDQRPDARRQVYGSGFKNPPPAYY